MNNKEFLNAMANGKTDVLQVFLETIAEPGTEYCVIGGLAVNAYAEPAASLDLFRATLESQVINETLR